VASYIVWIREKDDSRVCEAGLRDGGLEQLNGIAGRILEQDLLSANSLNNFVAETDAALSEQLDSVGDVVHLYDESVPSAWFGLRAVRHCLPTAALTAWCTEDKPQLAPIQHCKSRGWVHDLVKVQLLTVERDRGGDIVHDVADADTGYHVPPSRSQAS
jgi:hypothetical protein